MGGVIEEVVAEIKRLKEVVVFTGAGVSSESGLPTYRGRGGLWSDPEYARISTLRGFMEDLEASWRLVARAMEAVGAAKPSRAHRLIAWMEKRGYVRSVITQNVDGLHRRAGTRRLIELHGNIWRVRCTYAWCNYAGELRGPPRTVPPTCPLCGSPLRPGVVLFGEPLDGGEWSRAVGEAAASRVFLVVGTSGLVEPASSLPAIARSKGSIVVEVNPEETEVTGIASYSIRMRASEALEKIVEGLGSRGIAGYLLRRRGSRYF